MADPMTAADPTLLPALIPPRYAGQAGEIEQALTQAPLLAPDDQLADDARRERWRVTDDSAAEWCLRKLHQARAQLAQVHTQAEEWRDQIDAWRASAERDPARAEQFFTALLADYQARLRDEEGVKSRKLPSGTLRSRGGSTPQVHVADEPALLAWAAENLPADVHEAVVKVTEKVLVRALREHVQVDEQVTAWWVTVATGMEADASQLVGLLCHWPLLPEPGSLADAVTLAGTMDTTDGSYEDVDATSTWARFRAWLPAGTEDVVVVAREPAETAYRVVLPATGQVMPHVTAEVAPATFTQD